MRKFKHKYSSVEARQNKFGAYHLYINEKQIGVANPDRIERDTENWIEQIEKDYEILLVKGREGDPEYRDIHSVKRLSDGEVFSLGDEIEGDYPSGKRGTITKITEMPYNLGTYLEIEHGKGWDELKDIQKVTRKPILTSEDGIDLFEGDEAYPLTMGDLIELCSVKIHKTDPVKNWLYFSTREAAERYRVLNARLLSIEDFNQAGILAAITTLNADKLINIVKSRL